MSLPNADPVTRQLTQSKVLTDYAKAFSQATGLPLAFAPADGPRQAIRKTPFSNAFCLQLTQTQPGCKLCVDMQERICRADSETAQTASCLAGLTDTAVPVKVGGKVIGWLQTGQISLKPLSKGPFRRVAEWLKRGGAEADMKALEDAYMQSPVLNKVQYEAMIHLLEVFADHLSIAAEEIATKQQNQEPVMVQKARAFIEANQSEDIGLDEVAKAVNVSTYYFCKTFHKATGLTFTQYVALTRVAKAKKLLANPQLRISEIAYEVGFQSLTHFNRTFRKLTGKSPTKFREDV